GRNNPARAATRRAHRSASDRTRSAPELDRAAQPARELNCPFAPRCASRLTPGVRDSVDIQAPEVGLHQCPLEKKRQRAPARARLVPSLVPVHTQRAAKPRAFPPTAAGFTAERDSPLEGSGFEPTVPPPRVNCRNLPRLAIAGILESGGEGFELPVPFGARTFVSTRFLPPGVRKKKRPSYGGTDSSNP